MNDAVTEPRRDYRDTVFLPRTSFPMRGDLAKKEPQILARWEAMDLWAKLRAASAGRPLFILHDGPPYANGHLHIGTALNKILKDVINRTRQMAGYDANYIPGWDCHGLPIELKVSFVPSRDRAARTATGQVGPTPLRHGVKERGAHLNKECGYDRSAAPLYVVRVWVDVCCLPRQAGTFPRRV